MLTLVAAVLAYDRVERASETCERKSGLSGRSELRLAISDTSEENDMACTEWICLDSTAECEVRLQRGVRSWRSYANVRNAVM